MTKAEKAAVERAVLTAYEVGGMEQALEQRETQEWEPDVVAVLHEELDVARGELGELLEVVGARGRLASLVLGERLADGASRRS